MNSIIVATSAAFLATLFAALAAYAFAKKEFVLKGQLFMFLLASLIPLGLAVDRHSSTLLVADATQGRIWTLPLWSAAKTPPP